MKFLITENKLNNIILDYIKGYYNWDNITLENDEEVSDGENLFFYSNDNEIGDLFWYNGEDRTLEIYDSSFDSSLNSMFNNRWVPVFKKFIKDKFNIIVKRVEY